MSQPPLHHAHLDWNDAGTPISCQFGDVYFSSDNGLSETRHVFLQQNQLPARFSQHDNEVFVIGETGFGTGLNFLATCHAFLTHRANAENPVRLHFISFEKYPLTQDDLRKALAAWPELMPISQDLIDQWPLPLPGCHRLHFANGRIRLDLWLGDINDTLPHLPQHQDGLVDAWYLDGFAPAKNPEMWTQTLFDGLARLARPTATIATFTCAGFVRRGLLAAGFAMKKVKGHGKKREMLVGARLAKPPQPTIAPWYARPVGRQGDVLMIGGGIASAMTALSLVARGRRVTLLCQDSAPAIGASGNRQGALYPLLNGEHDALSRFYSLSFGYARQQLLALAKRHPVAFALCGVVQLGYDEKSSTKLSNMSQGPFPPALMHPVTSHETEQLTGLPCGHGGVHYPYGGWLCPADLTRAAIEEAQLSGLLQVEYSTQVSSVAEQPDLWQVTSETGRQWHAPNLVVAAGHHLPALIPFAALPLYPVRGQVSHIPTTTTLSQLNTVLCYDGYLNPPHHSQHCIGASYGRNQTSLAFSAEEQTHNQARLQACLPDQGWPREVDVSANDARVGVRCASRDHLPVVGPVVRVTALTERYDSTGLDAQQPAAPLPLYRGLYVLGALGSRGLCTASLCGELLASEICGDPLPLATDLLEALHPARYWVRKLLKGKPLPSIKGDQRLANVDVAHTPSLAKSPDGCR